MRVVYRVVGNHVLGHPQWIVVRDDPAGRPVLAGGPWTDERIAALHCDAMNRDHAKSRRKSLKRAIIAEYGRIYTLVLAGWSSYTARHQ